jgi:hypothetical protein
MRRRRPRREVEALTKGSSRSVAAFLRQDRAPLSWKNDGAEKGAASEDHEGEEVIPTSSSAATRCVDLLRSLTAPVAPESGNCGRSSPNSRQSHRARSHYRDRVKAQRWRKSGRGSAGMAPTIITYIIAWRQWKGIGGDRAAPQLRPAHERGASSAASEATNSRDRRSSARCHGLAQLGKLTQ